MTTAMVGTACGTNASESKANPALTRCLTTSHATTRDSAIVPVAASTANHRVFMAA